MVARGVTRNAAAAMDGGGSAASVSGLVCLTPLVSYYDWEVRKPDFERTRKHKLGDKSFNSGGFIKWISCPRRRCLNETRVLMSKYCRLTE